MSVSEKMMWSTYPIATVKGAATGFVMNRRVPASSGDARHVVLTSSHILDTLGKGPLVMALRMPDKEGKIQELALILAAKHSEQKRFYVRHPHHDIAAFPMDIPSELSAMAVMPSFISERGLSHLARSLHSGMEVAFLGYPDVLPGTEGAFGILRSGRIASYPVGKAQAKGCFLVNADVYPGDSGAPVFLVGRGGHPRLAGMIIRRVGPQSSSFSHLAIAVDAEVIRQTLDLLAQNESEARTGKGKSTP